MKKIKQTEALKSETHSIRLSQALVPFGAGAMVDFIDQTLMTASPEYWSDYTVIHDERLEKILDVDEFRMPPDLNKQAGIPFVRFPEWYFCPTCRRFQPLSQWQKEFVPYKNAKTDFMKTPTCMNCRAKLIPAGIITICENGHIDDFPWIEWTHYRDKKSICSKPKLKIKTGSSALGLEGIKLECACGAKATMKGAFIESVLEELGELSRCKGNKPWSGEREKCNLKFKTAQRGALNVYFSKIETSIVIPPYSDELTVSIENSREYTSLLSSLKKARKKDRLERFFKEDIEDYIEDIASELNKDEEAVRAIVMRKLNPDDKATQDLVTRNKYREEEYDALIGNIPVSSMNSKDFKIEKQNVEDYDIPYLNNVVLVKKLREVRVLTGFTRVNPPENNVIGTGEENSGKSVVVSIKEKDTNWYPAYETRGEGIFIELSESKIEEWLENNPEVEKRIEELNSRYSIQSKKNNFISRKITPKFVLLHTLAHLLIKELSFECGYSSASLQERIYCDQYEGDKNMSGILIYTSSGDSEGTLGGLVRQGYSDILPKIIISALKKAQWCSVDPVCIESMGQGRDSLNLAACHACTLIPETSCEEFNSLLDRAVLIGTLKDPNIGLFTDLIR